MPQHVSAMDANSNREVYTNLENRLICVILICILDKMASLILKLVRYFLKRVLIFILILNGKIFLYKWISYCAFSPLIKNKTRRRGGFDWFHYQYILIITCCVCVTISNSVMMWQI
jgi:hypothetical protein